MRLTPEQLKEIKEKLNVDRLWSYSSVSSYENDSYGYYLQKIAHILPDRDNSIYGEMGTCVHDLIEDFYLGKITRDEMINKFDESFNTAIILGKKFNRNDEDINTKGQNKYEKCIKHCLKNHNKPNGNFLSELPIIVKTNEENAFIGYVDFVSYKDNIFTITDFKTSSIYKGDDLIKKSAQLYLYALGITRRFNVGKRFNENFLIDNVKIQFDFLKYVNVKIIALNGKETIRQIERSEIGSKLASNIETKLKQKDKKTKESKYNDIEIKFYIDKVIETNSLDCLPKEIQNTYEITDCIVAVPIDKITISNICNKLNSTINEIKQKEIAYNNSKDDEIWCQEIKDDNDAFFIANISGYSEKVHKPYAKYLENKNMFRNDNKELDEEINNVNNNSNDLGDLNELFNNL